MKKMPLAQNDEIIQPMIDPQYVSLELYCKATGVTRKAMYNRINRNKKSYCSPLIIKPHGKLYIDYKAYDKFLLKQSILESEAA